MAVKLGLWSLTLVPGETYPIFVKNDFQISNAALAEELASQTGRSVLKVTHIPVNPAMFGDDSDSEIDSDLGDSDLDGEDEFELDVEEGFKEVEKKANGTKGDVSMEQDEEDEDEEEDSEEDEDFSDDEEEEVTNVICALTAGRIEQATLDLTFTEGDAIIFEVTGENAVHLMGNYIAQPNPYDSDSDDEDDHEHDDYDEMFDGESDEEDEDVTAFIEELKEPKTKKALTAAVAESKPKKAAAPTPAPAAAAPSDKKRKAEAIDSPASKTAAAPAAAAGAEGLSKAQKKKLNKKAKTEEAPAAAAAKPEVASAKAAGVKRTLPSGLIIEDIKKGDGPAAKGGKRLSMRYIGKLTDGKQFDANTAGKPFSFVLGRGEVIKGWDEGLQGMNVGGERRLTIPAQLAYGSQKIPGIPKNSTLKFEVKLLAVN